MIIFKKLFFKNKEHLSSVQLLSRVWVCDPMNCSTPSLCQENALVIANTLFQQHKRRLYTWTSLDGQYRNQIDYTLCNQRWRNSIKSAKTRLGADCGSDHELLIAKFRLKLKKVGKTIQVWPKSNPLWLYSRSDKHIQRIRSDGHPLPV